MARDSFLWIKDSGTKFEGESNDDFCPKWIELHSFSISSSQAIGAAQSTAGGRTGERCDISDLSISKDLDKTSPYLFKWCSDGEHLPKVVIRCFRSIGDLGEAAGGGKTGKQCYQTIVLKDALISSYSISGGAGIPMESVTFNPGAVIVNYIPTSHLGGEAGKDESGGQVPASWSLINNVADADTSDADSGSGAVS